MSANFSKSDMIDKKGNTIMNMNTANYVINHILNALNRNGSEGQKIATRFIAYRRCLELDAQGELGLSKTDIDKAFCDLLTVCLAEVTAGLDAEMDDYDSFWTDMKAYCAENCNPDNRDESCITEENATVDGSLSAEEKQEVYKMCARVVRVEFWKHGASQDDVADAAGGMYARLLSKRVNALFPHGKPTCKAEWMAFLRKDAEFAWKNFYKKAWRHPTSSLDEPIMTRGGEDDGEELCRVDLLGEEDSLWQPNRKDDFLASAESRHELQFVPKVFDRLTERCSPPTRKALKRLLLDEADIETVSAEFGMKPNALYVAKKRFLDALGRKGQVLLSEIEMSAA